jgi:hypothetical protein
MAISCNVPISGGTAPDLTFPARCVSCAQAAETTSRLLVVTNVTRRSARGRQTQQKQRKQQTVRIQFDVPHCAACAWSTKAVFLAGLIPFALGFLTVGGAAFVAAGLGAAYIGLDDVGRRENANSLVVGAAAGLFGGIAGGFLFELVARVLLLPIMGRALLRAPLLVPSFFTDSVYIAGLSARPNPDFTLTLTFANDEIAREFEAANARELAS